MHYNKGRWIIPVFLFLKYDISLAFTRIVPSHYTSTCFTNKVRYIIVLYQQQHHLWLSCIVTRNDVYVLSERRWNRHLLLESAKKQQVIFNTEFLFAINPNGSVVILRQTIRNGPTRDVRRLLHSF
jgi:hypothetical protein